MIKQQGEKYIVTDSSGEKILGTHESKKQAIKQLQAIEISKKEREQQDESRIMSFSAFIKENA
jgi:hypothetical protein